MKPSWLAACSGALLFASIAAAQSPLPDSGTAVLAEPRFDIHRFVAEGATLLTSQEIEAAVGPYRGTAKGFADVQRALEAMERAYSARGYNAVQVTLPEQEMARGEVRFRVIEAKIGAMVIEGNSFFDEPNIRASLPALTPGTAPNIHRVAENLRLANENPAKRTSVLLRSGAAEGAVDALVRVSDERPLRYRMTLDNTGTPQTGLLRAGLGFQHANAWNLAHFISMQSVTAPYAAGHPSRLSVLPDRNVAIIGAAYRIPIYRWGDSIDIIAWTCNIKWFPVLAVSVSGNDPASRAVEFAVRSESSRTVRLPFASSTAIGPSLVTRRPIHRRSSGSIRASSCIALASARGPAPVIVAVTFPDTSIFGCNGSREMSTSLV